MIPYYDLDTGYWLKPHDLTIRDFRYTNPWGKYYSSRYVRSLLFGCAIFTLGQCI